MNIHVPKYLLTVIGLFIYCSNNAQSFTNYFIGNDQDIVTTPEGGICMMGGRSEDDEAMKWFLKRANGGDILVLRASGSDGYNDYLFSELGVPVNSVESIVFHDASASKASYIHDKINKAEAIWFAGGDQWKYVAYWRDSKINELINNAINNRNVVVGGTSAGMAILGGAYFSAKNGTITSEEALMNPYHSNITVEDQPFLDLEVLANVLTDTHYDARKRQGRHVAFLARHLVDGGNSIKGIACDEYTAICIDNDGSAQVFSQKPAGKHNAYFIQVNESFMNNYPEQCIEGQSLKWFQDGKALEVYTIPGSPNGNNHFSLTDWKNGNGGKWSYWSVDQGRFMERPF